MKAVFCTPTVAGGKVYCGEGMHDGQRLPAVLREHRRRRTGVAARRSKPASHTEGAPAVMGGKVYFPAGDDGLFCADAATGTKLWQFPGGKAKGIHVDAPPAVQGGTVFVGSGLYTYVAVALDANSGAEKWRADLKLRSFGAPLASGGSVFFAVGTGNMGADTWHYDEEARDKEAAAAGAVVCLDAATGAERWRYSLPKSVHSGLAADAFSVYVGSRDGSVYALDRASGKLRWKADIGAGQPLLSCPAVASAGGFPVAVYAVSAVGVAVCLNPQTGVAAWQKPLPGFRWDGKPDGGVMCSPLIVSTPTATGSRRTVYIGAMTVDPQNPVRKTVAVFRFEGRHRRVTGETLWGMLNCWIVSCWNRLTFHSTREILSNRFVVPPAFAPLEKCCEDVLHWNRASGRRHCRVRCAGVADRPDAAHARRRGTAGAAADRARRRPEDAGRGQQRLHHRPVQATGENREGQHRCFAVQRPHGVGDDLRRCPRRDGGGDAQGAALHPPRRPPAPGLRRGGAPTDRR